ncbi:PP2C family protein-serine/threonine phosphatase [Kitasatospora sp. NPDC048540]|uniref:PP2C family protein-serine/threonine phosphatase n=1 Tax=unclassified Kitasatospora TaxID=2633591 RepID=UPI000539D60D|nr:PP2C family protein-serine/threonine phosphatase [Kitasatospora sp. MBT63]
MDIRARAEAIRRPGRASRALVVIPLLLIVLVCIGDVLAPPEVHLGPFLVAAPAITASFAGPRTTGFIGALAVLAQATVAAARTTLLDLNHTVQITALAVISALVTLFAYLREQHEKEMTQLRSVAEAAQQVVLRPIPPRMGPLRIASVYVAAEAEAQIGGDLYAAVRSGRATRFIVGDVRGKGLGAIGDAALVLGAFRAAAHRRVELTRLVDFLDSTVSGDLEEAGDDPERQESFTTAVLIDIPDGRPVLSLVDCGHPPPLLLRGGRVVALEARQPAPPLGLAAMAERGLGLESFPFEPGDTVLLYTDGVVEARDTAGRFYPLAERLAAWPADDPGQLLKLLCQDLAAHTGGRLGDDAAMVAIVRLPSPPG